jgi:hypothetical protein
MVDAKRGDLVQIHRIILKPEDRSPNLPADTRIVPYEEENVLESCTRLILYMTTILEPLNKSFYPSERKRNNS